MTVENKPSIDKSSRDLSIRDLWLWEKRVSALNGTVKGTKCFRDITDEVLFNYARGIIGEKHAELYITDIFAASKFAEENMTSKKDIKNIHKLQKEIRGFMVDLDKKHIRDKNLFKYSQK